ncbi:gamma-glutamyltransferase [Mongoliimonas terrestris]|uniref:gamma-glutamyltransferase n=1 Tax=Mongoliimonas terrestris TaxID=1709001 RepID=UPI000949597B|nr:gamma-glutamyltransferase [Mongoliimonas terrestris]
MSAPGFPRIADGYASPIRPVMGGYLGAVSAAHPLAAAAGQEMLLKGGTAVDAAIAAHAVLAVVMPDACGLGGDLLALVREPRGTVTAVNGCGAAPLGLTEVTTTGGASVTVPGAVAAWESLASGWGRLPLDRVLAPAIRAARGGIPVSAGLARAVADQRARLEAGRAAGWTVVTTPAGGKLVQEPLARILDRIAKEGARALYRGAMADAVARAVSACGGTLDEADLAAHQTLVGPPVAVGYRGIPVHVQPPPSQGVLLALCLTALDRLDGLDADNREHALVELTEASFAHRDRAGEGASLLRTPITIDLARASGRGGPRAYLHTAGVATADADGMVVSSLSSVFDDFGSGVFVPEGGFVLANRAGGFTDGANAPAPGRRPVHTLAPILVETPRGPLAFATPGADGQVQTLLQVLSAMVDEGRDLASAVAAPRWRSEEGRLLVEDGHPAIRTLEAFGHAVHRMKAGHVKFGAVTAAGVVDGQPICVADWRRETTSGVA